MLNKPSETSYLPATLSKPKPGDFPIGSVESKAAARMLAGKRKEALIPVMCIQINNAGVLDDSENIRPCRDGDRQPLLCCELDPTAMGNTPVNWMTRQELDAKQREYDEYQKRCAIERDTSRPSEKEVRDPAALDEKKPGAVSPTADAAPRYAPVEEKLDWERQDAARESRVEEYGNYLARRPIARKPWYRRRLWPDGVWR